MNISRINSACRSFSLSILALFLALTFVFSNMANVVAFATTETADVQGEMTFTLSVTPDPEPAPNPVDPSQSGDNSGTVTE